jgi:hypothetical protein
MHARLRGLIRGWSNVRDADFTDVFYSTDEELWRGGSRQGRSFRICRLRYSSR